VHWPEGQHWPLQTLTDVPQQFAFLSTPPLQHPVLLHCAPPPQHTSLQRGVPQQTFVPIDVASHTPMGLNVHWLACSIVPSEVVAPSSKNITEVRSVWKASVTVDIRGVAPKKLSTRIDGAPTSHWAPPHKVM
jgi:hypothetical protein